MINKPSIPQGTRDFPADVVRKRNYIFSVIRNVFELYGFQPLETPAMENLDTLMGKYGEEGDKLIFKILNNGLDHEKNIEKSKVGFEKLLEGKSSADITERALKYDLTIPFARYVAMNHTKLTFPFRRYQIQPVWRADRPQKGRYREFYQCDADVIGSNSLVNDLDLISLMDKCFIELQLPVVIKFNNRKILTALAEMINAPDKIIDITVAIDKLDKIGKDGVNKELTEKGISNTAIQQLQPLLDFTGNNAQKLEVLEKLVGNTEFGKKGIEEINYLLRYSKTNHATLELDITLARGLNYYTGTIFEVKANAGNFTPSILGGGRYDDLTGIFGLPNMSGVGISFGVDRIYDVMEELNLFPESISKTSTTKLVFAHFDANTQSHCLDLAAALRAQNIACEVYPDLTKKLAKQFDYANKKNIPFVCTVGSNEMEKGVYSLKDMQSGTQHELRLEQLIQFLK